MPRGHAKNFTQEQLERAKALRDKGASWREVAAAIGDCGEDSIHAAVDPEYRQHRNAQSLASHSRARNRKELPTREMRRVGYREARIVRLSDPPPIVVVEEARRAYAAPRTITADFFGDPPYGRSALDKRQASL